MALKFVLTDTHGCKRALEIAISRGRKFAETVGQPIDWVFLGDYVDRGPDSKGVVELVRDMQRQEDAVCLAGNHDVMFSEAILHNRPGDWLYNNPFPCAQSYGYFEMDATAALSRMRDDPKVIEDCEWIDSLRLYHEDDQRIYVHAGIYPETAMVDQVPFDLIWIREPFLNYAGEFPKRVVHGHSRHLGHPNCTFSNRTNLDTGIAYGYALTMGVFTENHSDPIGFIIVTKQDVENDANGVDVCSNVNFNRLGGSVRLDGSIN